jgi:hypothetical protein
MNLHDLLPAVIIVVIIVLAAAFSASILSSIQATQTTNSAAYNTTGYGLTTLTNISQQMPNIGLILVVAVIIGILVGSFLVYQSKR